jgi:uncharacterized membrane protein YfcA
MTGADLPLLMQIAVGAATGTVTGLTGASGMAFLASSLLVMGLDAKQVIAATFLLTSVNALAALLPRLRHESITRADGLFIIAPSVAGGLVGFALAGRVHSAVLEQGLVVLMFGAGLVFLVRGKATPRPEARLSHGLAAPVAFFAGLFIGGFGGGGTVLMALLLVTVFGFGMQKALTLSFAVAVAVCLPLAALSYANGTLLLSATLVILLAALPCAVGAGILSQRIPDGVTRKLLGAYLVLTSVYMLVTG